MGNGSHYSFKEIKLGQGRLNVAKFLTENEEIRFKIENKLREKIGLKLASPIVTKVSNKSKDSEKNNEKIVQPLFEGENKKE